jgi:hypothetical protein
LIVAGELSYLFNAVLAHFNLEKTELPTQTSSITDKEIVQDLLRRVPDNASLQDIARELEFIAAVRQGLTELDNGLSVVIEEVEQELHSYTNIFRPHKSRSH